MHDLLANALPATQPLQSGLHLYLAQHSLSAREQRAAPFRAAGRRQGFDVLGRRRPHLLCHAPQTALQDLRHHMRVSIGVDAIPPGPHMAAG